MEKLLANKPAFIKATPPASTMLADQDEARLNLERMSDDLDQASSQAWLDAQRAAERMLAKREAASLGSIPASVVTNGRNTKSLLISFKREAKPLQPPFSQSDSIPVFLLTNI